MQKMYSQPVKSAPQSQQVTQKPGVNATIIHQ